MINIFRYYLFSIFCHFLEIIFSAITFKKMKDKILFSSDAGLKYEGNSKYYFEWLCEQDEKNNSYWVARDKNLYDQLVLNNPDKILYYYSLKFIWFYMTSSILFNTHSHTGNDVNKFCSFNFFIVNLWHGVPLKKMPKVDGKSFLKLIFVKRECDLWLVMTEKETEKFSDAYGLSKDVFFKALYPRLEFLSNLNKSSLRIGDRIRVLYMPTFREEESTYYFKYGIFLDSKLGAFLEDCFRKEGFNLTIKYHPYTKRSMDTFSSNVIGYESKETVENLLLKADVLITDYSSVAFDFTALGKKVVFYVPDLDVYREKRGIDDDFYDYLSKYAVFDWENVFKKINSNDSCVDSNLFNLDARFLPGIKSIHEEVLKRSNVY